ncbi:glutamine-hydrolyzing GMP synthase [Chitinispirillales bacterium ANBcel5]|uniref:glutamine-hydrolyzing GMP synthase n=1 Tax=Cellulosispirillum alkaliphilum TaxID=3039283 RepID=UPI002A5283BE|nr:glutamine-hydrolyzing GMP synthase [Chitinispirillales bacterium ANBcel5]
MTEQGLEKIAVLDFGGQYSHLIANRIRRLGVYSEILPCDVQTSRLKEFRGIILSGGPRSVLENESPVIDPGLIDIGIPVLGLCYGHQVLARTLGGKICRGKFREYGRAAMSVLKAVDILAGLSENEQIWMSHGDSVEMLPSGFEILATTENCPTAAVGDRKRQIFGLQFHPEVTDTPNGMKILGNFIDICKCSRAWNSDAFIEQIESEIRDRCGDKKVFLLVSGGVDSTVAFTLLNKILGPQKVLGLHIDNGLMRHQESSAVLQYMHENGYDNLKIEDASQDFLTALDGVSDPEQKRAIIGKMFITVKEKAFEKLGLNSDEWILAQGTIYPDMIESAGTTHSDKIKTHHNRVDVILELIEKGLVVEPLAQLYKDEVRELGEALGIPKSLVWRHPFPGPGLGVRTLCSDGAQVVISQQDQDQLENITADSGYSASILPIRSVGVQGDERTYAYPALICGEKPDWTALESISTRITNNLKSVNRVIYGLNTQGNNQYKLHKAYLTRERLDKLRSVDKVVTEALHKSGEYGEIWQMPVVLLPLINQSGEECVVLRPIVSQEAMTARFVPLAQETLETILNNASAIKGIGDIFFDITHKPPATIEWE